METSRSVKRNHFFKELLYKMLLSRARNEQVGNFSDMFLHFARPFFHSGLYILIVPSHHQQQEKEEEKFSEFGVSKV